MARARQPPARWWDIRRAQNRKPSTYRCPLCGNQLPSLMEHMLITPEGDASRRRHAHTACVVAAREQGRLPTQAEWRKVERQAQRAERPAGVPGGPIARLRDRWRRRGQ